MVAADVPDMEVRARTYLAYWGVFDGDAAEARRHGRRALELARPVGNDAYVSMALSGLAAADIFTGDRQSADRYLIEARHVASEAGLDTFEMFAQRIAAQAALRFADKSARRLAEDALHAARGVSSQWDVAGCAYLAGVAAIADGDVDAAQLLLQESHDASLDPWFPWPLGHALLGLSHLASIEFDPDRERDLARQALDAFAAWGSLPGIADAIEAVAAVGQGGGAAATLGSPPRRHRHVPADQASRTFSAPGRTIRASEGTSQPGTLRP